MKIGIFDSGLGGLFILKSIIEKLPQYDYVYLGDTKRVPYGNRSKQTVYEFTCEAVNFLFRRNCQLIILACNTASALALRRLQKEYLPRHYPDRRVLGVIIPTIEAAADSAKDKIGVLGTLGTVSSNVFPKEFRKASPRLKIYQQAAPLLVPLVENDSLKFAAPILREYLKPLLRHNVKTIVLGCTHYPLLKNKIRQMAGRPAKCRVRVISQDEIMPAKLADYLSRHPEITRRLSQNHGREFLVTDLTESFTKTARRWFGKKIKLRLVSLQR
jgi:glutamate racemase